MRSKSADWLWRPLYTYYREGYRRYVSRPQSCVEFQKYVNKHKRYTMGMERKFNGGLQLPKALISVHNKQKDDLYVMQDLVGGHVGILGLP